MDLKRFNEARKIVDEMAEIKETQNKILALFVQSGVHTEVLADIQEYAERTCNERLEKLKKDFEKL